jgi:hypothetical protein
MACGGRQAGHRLVLAVHQPNLRLFGDSDSRGQYGYRLITGAYTSSLWRMTFGYAPRIEWDTRIKGRGVVGVGEAENLIHAAQLTWMPAEERRRYALTGPPPPDWFTAMRPAPWIDARVISEGRKLAGCPWSMSRPSMSHPDQTSTYLRKHAGLSCPPSRPRTTRPGPWPASPRPPGRTAPRPPHRRRTRPQHGHARTARRRPAGDDTATPAPAADEVIVGIAAAARASVTPRPAASAAPHPPSHPRRDQDRRRSALLDP